MFVTYGYVQKHKDGSEWYLLGLGGGSTGTVYLWVCVLRGRLPRCPKEKCAYPTRHAFAMLCAGGFQRNPCVTFLTQMHDPKLILSKQLGPKQSVGSAIEMRLKKKPEGWFKQQRHKLHPLRIPHAIRTRMPHIRHCYAGRKYNSRKNGGRVACFFVKGLNLTLAAELCPGQPNTLKMADSSQAVPQEGPIFPMQHNMGKPARGTPRHVCEKSLCQQVLEELTA